MTKNSLLLYTSILYFIIFFNLLVFSNKSSTIMDLFHLFKIFIKISEIYWQFSYFDQLKNF